jgi:sodium-dependent dicarboxylate transporter 2/3/5
VLEAIGAGVERWDALRDRPAYRVVGLLLGAVVFVGILSAPAPEGLTPESQRAAALLVLMAGWWISGVLPLAITALLPLLLVPLLGLGQMKTTAGAYFDPLNFLMLGGFVLGHGMETVGLHKRLTSALLAPAAVRSSPRRVLLAVMTATAILSCLMSNTASMLMMLPLAALMSGLATEGRARTAFPLGVAYAASIGGVGTLVGTPSNAVIAAQSQKLIGHTVTFADWLVVGIPFVALATPAAWWAVTVALAVPGTPERPIEAPQRRAWTLGEGLVLGVIGCAFFGWLTRAPIDFGGWTFPGWSASVGPVDDAWVAILAAAALFALPTRDERGWRFLMDWRETERAIPWGVLLLLGGGFALADAVKESGLVDWLAQGGVWLSDLPLPLATLLICGSMVVLTEFTSNTAAAQLAVPVFAAAAQGAGVDPLLWMVPATIAVSCGFMMPAGTGPNAIATEAGGVRPGDMAYAGLLVNVICAVLATAISLLAVPWLR